MEINKNLLPEIILVNTQLPENLGATARGMLNFKFEKLRLVEPKFPLSNEKIIPVAAGADRVIKKTQVFKKFTDCVKDFNYLIGTSNRIRSIKKNEISLENLGKLIQQKKDKIGIVFGPEQSGLDNETLSLCDFTLKINSNSKFSSLNLSHAVTLVCYNLFKKLDKKSKKEKTDEFLEIATKEELISFYKILERNLNNSSFFNVEERKKIIFQKIKNIFSKTKLSSEEIRILISVFKKNTN